MPELPEVEHVTRALRRVLIDRIIETAELRRRRLAPDISPKRFSLSLAGARINIIHRRGKHILFDLDNGRTLIVHLRMSGRFMLLTPDDIDPKFTHAVFNLSEGTRLVFQDQRHFGLMKIVKTNGLFQAKELAKLAPEPFSDDFSPEYFARTVATSGRVLKEFLLDQTKVCGVGNIYASEALFLSGISPKRKGRNLSRRRSDTLYDNVKAILNEAIEMMNSIIPDPVVIGEGVYGNNTKHPWRVYDREGEPCPNCTTAIKRIRQGARSTYYCPKCQR